jgi:hypothetical protein
LVREGILTLNPLEVHLHFEVTTIGETKNKNEKRNLETIRETLIIGKNARKLSKNKSKLEKIREVTDKTSQEVGLEALNLAGIAEPHKMGLFPGKAI